MTSQPDPLLIELVKALARSSAVRDTNHARGKEHARAHRPLCPIQLHTAE